MTKLLALASLLALSATAGAQNLVAADAPEPEHPAPRFLDARLGAMLGTAQVGDSQNFSPGISGGLGYRFGDVMIRGLADYYRVGDDPSNAMARRGRATRLGAAARYSFVHTDRDSDVNVDFWGELGGGYEHVAWLAGGVLDRPSGEVAFGLDAGRRSDRDHAGRRNEIGYFMALRSHIAEAPQMPGAVATCGGPCTSATTPPRTDVSMFFELGVHWGR
jgi:hypothetical protein